MDYHPAHDDQYSKRSEKIVLPKVQEFCSAWYKAGGHPVLIGFMMDNMNIFLSWSLRSDALAFPRSFNLPVATHFPEDSKKGVSAGRILMIDGQLLVHPGLYEMAGYNAPDAPGLGQVAGCLFECAFNQAWATAIMRLLANTIDLDY